MRIQIKMKICSVDYGVKCKITNGGVIKETQYRVVEVGYESILEELYWKILVSNLDWLKNQFQHRSEDVIVNVEVDEPSVAYHIDKHREPASYEHLFYMFDMKCFYFDKVNIQYSGHLNKKDYASDWE